MLNCNLTFFWSQVDVEMFMDEWFQKIHELDTAHSSEIDELNEQRAQICSKVLYYYQPYRHHHCH